MTDRSRLVQAGVDVLGIATTRVRVSLEGAWSLEPDEHPAWALCRGLAALGFGDVAFSASDAAAPGLERRLPRGVRRLGSPDEPCDLWLHAGGADHAESALRAAERHGARFLSLVCADDRVRMYAGAPPNDARGGIAAPFAARIGAGLLVQEAVVWAGGLELASEPAESVGFDAGGALWRAPLEDAAIEVVGAGGIGIHLLETLTPMLGRGSELRIFDFDRVGRENLATQPVFRERDLGRPKVEVVAERLEPLRHPHLALRPFPVRYEQRPLSLGRPALRIACPDTFAARRMLNDLSLADGVPLVEGASSPLAAQQRSYVPGRTACLAHRIPGLAERADEEDDRGSCAAENAWTLPGPNMICAGWLALEALRALAPARFGPPTPGTLTYDARFPERLGSVDERPACTHEQAAYTPAK